MMWALFGAGVGLLLTFASQKTKAKRKKNKLKKILCKYNGEYVIKTKSGQIVEKFENFRINYKTLNYFDFQCKINNSPVSGMIIVDEKSLVEENQRIYYGTGFYVHIGEEYKEMSGFYEYIFLDNLSIHAKCTYINKKTNTEVIHQYIWEKKV